MSTIAENLQKLITAKTNIRNAILDMGGTCPSDHGFEDFDDDIDSIPTGGGTCLTFKGTKSFTLKTYNTSKNWDGTLQYSTDGSTWTTWDGVTTISSTSSSPYVLYLRGTGNTRITGTNDANGRFQFTTTGTIDCIGRIDTLLDYQTVENSGTPTMASYCYYSMFYGCTSLTSAPALPATTLVDYCYCFMFNGCTSLTTAPALPATTLANYCYGYMFRGCTALVCPPGVLPATTLASNCYYSMFYNCTSLTTAPALPATTLASSCYRDMFYGCTSLTSAPALPATTLRSYCYSYMFYECTSLTSAPGLPATTLASYCYYYMFYGCTSLLYISNGLPATTLATYCYGYMFEGCTSLRYLTTLPATTLADYCYYRMFYGCTALKLSSKRTNAYIIPYEIPTSGTGTAGTSSLNQMFSGTGGIFTGTPVINTEYYVHTDNLWL